MNRRARPSRRGFYQSVRTARSGKNKGTRPGTLASQPPTAWPTEQCGRPPRWLRASLAEPQDREITAADVPGDCTCDRLLLRQQRLDVCVGGLLQFVITQTAESTPEVSATPMAGRRRPGSRQELLAKCSPLRNMINYRYRLTVDVIGRTMLTVAAQGQLRSSGPDFRSN